MFARPTPGYAEPMSDSHDAETEPGTATSREEGLVATSPPGGPQRQDGAGGPLAGGHDDDTSASPAADASAEEAGGHTIPIDQEQPGGEPAPTGDEATDDEAQEENAETSLDQPSQ